MSLASNLSDAFTRVATETKSLRVLINGNAADLSGLTTTAKSNLVAAINEIDASLGSAGATQLDELTDVVITTAAAGHILRHNGTNFINVDGSTVFDPAGSAAAAQAASQPLDSDLTSIAALSTTAYGRAFLALANQAALMALLAQATEAALGVVEIATQAETNTGTDDARVVTPLKLQTRLAAYAQPIDSDLTSIAALSTTTYGRSLLTLADQAALVGLLPSATELASGIVELASTTEATTGTDTARAVTPAGLKAAIDAANAALIDGAPGLLDTLNEIAAALGDDPNFAATITTALANRLRVDTAAQGLTGTQQANGRTNLDVYSKGEVGDVTTNFVTVFEAGLV